MEILIGAVLALSVGLSATSIGLDRDRAFYPTVMAVSVAGFRRSLWLVVAALAVHGVFDLVHGQLIANPGVPRWWPRFCLAFDVVAAVYLAWLLARAKVHAAAT